MIRLRFDQSSKSQVHHRLAIGTINYCLYSYTTIQQLYRTDLYAGRSEVHVMAVFP